MTPHSPTADALADAHWRTSSYSAPDNECVSVAESGSWVGIRDSKQPKGPTITMTTDAFTSAITALRAGTL